LKRKRKTKRKQTLLKTTASPVHLRVKEAANRGLVEDEIVSIIGAKNRNALRRDFIHDIKAGRAENRKAKAEAASVSKEDQALMAVIKKSFDSDWYSPEFGNDLFGGTYSIKEAFAWAKANGNWK
jgi:uncharacterized protein YdbL (DUF1318 family)